MNEGRRFAVRNPWKNPEALFPSFMAALKLRYPDYSMVWDNDQEKWCVLRRLSPTRIQMVAWVEAGDGVAMDPSIEWLDRLSQCEVLRNFGSVEEYGAWLEAESERAYEEGSQRLSDEMAYAARPYIDYISRGGPESFVIRPLSQAHRRQVDKEIALSIPGTAIPQESA